MMVLAVVVIVVVLSFSLLGVLALPIALFWMRLQRKKTKQDPL